MAQSDVIPLQKKRSDNTLTSGFESGAKTIKISATGTLEWVSGATLTGASDFRASAGLVIGTDVQAYDADLTTWAGITPSANVQTLLATADYAAFRTQLGLGTLAVQNFDNVAISGGGISGLAVFSILNSGTGVHNFQINHIGTMTGSHTLTFNLNNSERAISLSGNLTVFADATLSGTNTGDQTLNSLLPSQTGNSGKYLTTDGMNASWGAISTGITIGSTAITGGTSGRLLVSGATVGELALGTDMSTWLGTPSSANLAAALTDETGSGKAVMNTSPSFTTSIIVNKTGQSEAAGLEVTDDPLNGAVRALYILPPADYSRIYVGKSGLRAYSINLANCLQFENMPYFTTFSGMSVGYVLNTYINRGDGGTEIGANHPTGYGLDIYQDSSWSTADITHRAVNVHRTNGLTLFGSSTTRTNYEALNLDYDGTQYVIKPVAGSGGGTVRPVKYHTAAGVSWSSGSGSPEGVVAGDVGSLYTRTDGGAGTTFYVKESGTGNTGWVAK